MKDCYQSSRPEEFPANQIEPSAAWGGERSEVKSERIVFQCGYTSKEQEKQYTN